MPIVIHEVIAEVVDEPTTPSEAHPEPQQMPAAATEQAMLATLALIRQRQERLRAD